MSNQFIVDTDPGLDDALALSYFWQNHDVDLITTVAGNVDLQHTTDNAAHLRDAHNAETPIRRGAAKPVQARQVTTPFHGETGLGSQEAPRATVNDVHSDYVDEDATILCIAPLTNIAHLVNTMDVSDHDYIILAGTRDDGNIHGAEYNVYADPHAARTVFSSDARLTVLPIDTVHGHGITFDDAREHHGPNDVITTAWHDLVTASDEAGSPAVYPYDLIAAYLAHNNDAYTTERCDVTVHTDPSERGKTEFENGDQLDVITRIDDGVPQRAIHKTL